MSKQARLQRRGSRYFLRAKVPADLVKVLGKREIKRALNTSVYSEALDRLREARRRANAPQLGNEPIRRVTKHWSDVIQLGANPLHRY